MGFTREDRDGLDKTLKDLNLSNEETEKFAKAFKDPEFIKLFEDYAKEVSDPKVKAETDMYLRQLEMEGRVEEVYGKGAQLILPIPVFAVKSHNSVDDSKVFINICTSDKVDKASLKSAIATNGKKGQNFDMPLCLGPKKTGVDKAGGPASIWDFVVNPETISMADATPAIKRVMIDTAMENIERNNPGTKLNRDYKLPKMTYKGTEACPTPHALALRGEGGTSVNGHVKPTPSAHQTADRTVPTATSTSNSGSGTRSSFSFGAPLKENNAPAAAEPLQIKVPTQAGYVHPGGEVTPRWEVVHRGLIDLSETWGDAGRGMVINTTHPKELVVYVTLPGVSSVSAVQLDVSRNDISILVPGKYQIAAAPLPFAVDSDQGRAKFDKAKGQLEVVLPVIPPLLPAPAPAFQAALVEEVPKETDHQEGRNMSLSDSAAVVSAQAVRLSSQEQAETVEQSISSDLIMQAEPCIEKSDGMDSSPSHNEIKTENQKKWDELHVSEAPAVVMSKKMECQATPQEDPRSDMTAAPPDAAPRPQQPIKLKPRLKSNIAEELD